MKPSQVQDAKEATEEATEEAEGGTEQAEEATEQAEEATGASGGGDSVRRVPETHKKTGVGERGQTAWRSA